MEMVLYTIVAVALYFISDWILNRIEESRGERLENRSLVFFIIIGVLAVVTFELLQRFLEQPTL